MIIWTIVGKAGVGMHPVARGVENEETKERKGKSILLTKAVFVCSGMNTIQSRESVIIAS